MHLQWVGDRPSSPEILEMESSCHHTLWNPVRWICKSLCTHKLLWIPSGRWQVRNLPVKMHILATTMTLGNRSSDKSFPKHMESQPKGTSKKYVMSPKMHILKDATSHHPHQSALIFTQGSRINPLCQYHSNDFRIKRSLCIFSVSLFASKISKKSHASMRLEASKSPPKYSNI